MMSLPGLLPMLGGLGWVLSGVIATRIGANKRAGCVGFVLGFLLGQVASS
ncbi:MAG: hypothetical protein ABIK62_02570 [candidate division WOR-3 bacterium]